jgi:hypothetical protein
MPWLWQSCRWLLVYEPHDPLSTSARSGMTNPKLTWVLTMQGQCEAGLVQLRQGLSALLTTGQALSHICLILFAEAAGHTGQVEEGLRLLTEAITALKESERGDLRAETYRLQGELLPRQAIGAGFKPAPTEAAETSFQRALAIARRQQAKSWELRAAMSLSRLWQRQAG